MNNLSKYKTGQLFPERKDRNNLKTVINRAKSEVVKLGGQSRPPDSMTAKLAIYGHTIESQ